LVLAVITNVPGLPVGCRSYSGLLWPHLEEDRAAGDQGKCMELPGHINFPAAGQWNLSLGCIHGFFLATEMY
jgi:hypothetical protein